MKADWAPGLSVTLEIDQRSLDEHKKDEAIDELGTPVERFVEASPGTCFAIVLHFSDGFCYPDDCIKIAVFLDGHVVCNEILHPIGEFPLTTHRITGSSDFVEGRWQVRRFAFSTLKTTEISDGKIPAGKYSKLGDITVELSRGRITGELPERNGPKYASTSTMDDIPEKALKGRAISTCASLRDPEPTSKRRTVSLEHPYGRVPFVEFKFKHRSRRDLQIEGLIPRSPSPGPLEDRDPDDLSPEEARELIRIMRVKQRDLKRVKPERHGRSTQLLDEMDSSIDDVAVIEERSTKRPCARKASEIDTVDLTED